MGAVIKGPFALHPVTNVRFKKAGTWRNVNNAYILVNGNLRKWWPDVKDLEGVLTPMDPVLSNGVDSDYIGWDPSNNNIHLWEDESGGRQEWSQVSYPGATETFYDEWFDNRNASAFGLQANTAFAPRVVQQIAKKDGSGWWLIDEFGVRSLDRSEIGNMLVSRSLPRLSDSEADPYVWETNKPLLVAGGDPILSQINGDPDFGPVVENNDGYINSPIGRDSFFHNLRSGAMDPAGENLYLVDSDNHAIRKVELSGDFPVTTLCGYEPTGTRGTAYTAPSSPSFTEGVGTNARIKMDDDTCITIHPSGEYALVLNVNNIARVWLTDTGSKVTGQVELFAQFYSQSSTEFLPRWNQYVDQIAFDLTGRYVYSRRLNRIYRTDIETSNGATEVLYEAPTIDNPSGSGSQQTNFRHMDVHSSEGWLVILESKPPYDYAFGITVVK